MFSTLSVCLFVTCKIKDLQVCWLVWSVILSVCLFECQSPVGHIFYSDLQETSPPGGGSDKLELLFLRSTCQNVKGQSHINRQFSTDSLDIHVYTGIKRKNMGGR